MERALRSIAVATLCALVLAAPAVAFGGLQVRVVQASAPDCSAPLSERDMTICAQRDYEQAEAVLDATYFEARSLMAARSAGVAVLLENAQSAWIPFRDKTCAAEAASFDVGSMQAFVTFDCLTRLTERRTADLAAIVERWQ